MTKRLEEIFGFDTISDPVLSTSVVIKESSETLAKINDAIDKIDTALPAILDLDASDKELDELSELAKKSFDDLSSLGFNVDSRYASEIFAVAGTMLGHAITAKTAKLNKKLRMVDLQLKKARLDQTAPEESTQVTAHGTVLDRNELLERLIGDRNKTNKTT